MSRGLLPILDRTFINTDGSRLEDRVPAFLLLLLIVPHGFDGRVAQDEAGRDVDEAHDGHEDIGDIPDSGHGHAGADEDDEDTDDAENIDETVGRRALVDEADAVIDIEQVADERGKTEEQHADRNQERTEAAEDGRSCILDVSRTGYFLSDGHAREEAHESRSTADQEGIDEDRQHLDQALFDRMADIGCGCCIRCRTDTGFVGIEAALDTVDHAGAGHAAEDGLEVEGIGEDHGEDLRQAGNVEDDDDERCQDIDAAHERNQDRCDLDDALAATDEAVGDESRKNGADDPRRRRRVVEAVDQERRLHVERAEQVEAAGISHDQGKGEEDAEPALVHGRFNVVGRTAVAVAQGIAALVNLGQRAFNEGRSPADDGQKPHPENGTGTAQADCRRDADDIARTDTGRRRNHEGLERRYFPGFRRFFHDDADTFREQAQLDTARLPGKNKAGCNEDDH